MIKSMNFIHVKGGTKMLSLRQLLIFKTVSETESFTRAADVLFITQSAVSHAIRDLENEMHTILFDRLSRQVRLTSSGRLLLDEILPLLSSCEALENRLQNLDRKAPVHLVSSITIAVSRLPAILLSFQEKWPDVPVCVDVLPAAAALEKLRCGGADLALAEGIPPQGPFLSRTFARYDMLAACAPGYHFLQEIQPDHILSVSAFCRERLLLREKGSAIRDCLDSALLLLGMQANPAWTSVNSPALIEAAKAGLGITVLPDILLRDSFRSNALIPLSVEGLTLSNEMHLVLHADKYLSAPLQDLVKLI